MAYALQSVAEAVARTGSTLAAGPAGHFLPPLPEGGFNLVALALTFAAGVASLPHLVMRAGTTVGAHSTRRSLAWALFFVLVILMTAPAYGAYAKLALFKLVASQGTGGLPGWVYDFGQAGLVRICGVNAVDPETVRRACDAAAGGVLLPSDIAVGADAIALGLPAIADLPPIMTGLVAAGILAAALSAAQALLLALANTAGHDLCFKLLAPHASVGRRLVITRLVMIVTGLVALWLARASQDWLFAFAAASLALAASAYFPILVLGIWWRGCTRLGALAGMVAGFAVAAGYAGLVHFTGMPLWPVVGPSAGGLPTMAAGIIGMPAAVLVAVGVSLLQPITARQDDDLA